MQQISSKLTFYYKRIFPVVFFGFLVVFFFTAVAGAVTNGQPAPAAVALVPVIVIGVVGYLMMKKLLFDLADEVLDAGNWLIVREGGREDRIALRDIMNVSYTPVMNPPRVTLLLRRPSLFGDQVAFVAPMRWLPFAASPVIEALIRRVDQARRVG